MPEQQPGYAQPLPLQMGYGGQPLQGYGQPQPLQQMCYGGQPPQQQMGYQPPQMMQQPMKVAGGMKGSGGMMRQQRLWAPPLAQELPPGCSPGLQFLVPLDKLFVAQTVEVLEALTDYEAANRYEVFSIFGHRLYLTMEQSGACARQCCGPSRGFDMILLDSLNQEVIQIKRSFVCCNCCCGCCCGQKLQVFSPPGNLIGTVQEVCGYPGLRLALLDGEGKPQLMIQGPVCVCGVGDQFDLLGADGATQVGRVGKQWTGLVPEIFTDADNFGISFPMDLDAKMKAVVLASAFLIDFMYYEKKSSG